MWSHTVMTLWTVRMRKKKGAAMTSFKNYCSNQLVEIEGRAIKLLSYTRTWFPSFPPYSFYVEKWIVTLRETFRSSYCVLVSLKKGGREIKSILASYFIFFCGFFPSPSSECTQPLRPSVFFPSVTTVYACLCYIPSSYNHTFLNVLFLYIHALWANNASN